MSNPPRAGALSNKEWGEGGRFCLRDASCDVPAPHGDCESRRRRPPGRTAQATGTWAHRDAACALTSGSGGWGPGTGRCHGRHWAQTAAREAVSSPCSGPRAPETRARLLLPRGALRGAGLGAHAALSTRDPWGSATEGGRPRPRAVPGAPVGTRPVCGHRAHGLRVLPAALECGAVLWEETPASISRPCGCWYRRWPRNDGFQDCHYPELQTDYMLI